MRPLMDPVLADRAAPVRPSPGLEAGLRAMQSDGNNGPPIEDARSLGAPPLPAYRPRGVANGAPTLIHELTHWSRETPRGGRVRQPFRRISFTPGPSRPPEPTAPVTPRREGRIANNRSHAGLPERPSQRRPLGSDQWTGHGGLLPA